MTQPQIQLSIVFVRDGIGDNAVFYRAQSSGDPVRNNLKFLGQIDVDGEVFTPAKAVGSEDQDFVNEWAIGQFEEFINAENAPEPGVQTHHSAEGDPGDYLPWYAIFSHRPGEGYPEDMWIARFEKNSPTPKALDAEDGVYMALPADDETPTFNGEHVVMRLLQSTRSVVFPTQRSAGEYGNGGSSGHGGTDGAPKREWE